MKRNLNISYFFKISKKRKKQKPRKLKILQQSKKHLIKWQNPILLTDKKFYGRI
jgi:hypothetical protein